MLTGVLTLMVGSRKSDMLNGRVQTKEQHRPFIRPFDFPILFFLLTVLFSSVYNRFCVTWT